MQLLLSTVYQQAKKTDRNVELAIDEAHYLFEDQANLDFLETAFRHQRHAGLRMVLLSQTAQEFYETDQAEKILGMCPIKVFHKLPDLDDETADKIGLTREQRQYVRGADAGKGTSATVRHSSVSKNTGPTHCTSLRIRSRSASLTTNQQIRFIIQAISEQSEELVDFDAFVENEAQMNALTSRYDLCEQEATRLLDGELSRRRSSTQLLRTHSETARRSRLRSLTAARTHASPTTR